MRIISVIDILEQTVQNMGNKIAVVDEKESFTYLDLQDHARAIGYALNQILSGKIQRPVMLFMEKSCRCIAAMVGILYSGNIYVPMDVKTPIERIKSIQSTLESDLILAAEKDKAILDRIGYRGRVLVYEELIGQYCDCVKYGILGQIKDRVIDTDLMYILFTSGSTGMPKGVAVRHQSVIDYIDGFMEEIGISSYEIVGNQAPFYTDFALRDIYMTMRAGATVCIIPQKYFMSPKKLLGYLEEKGVTFLLWVPTAYRIIAQFDGLSKMRPKKLERFAFSGETMPISVYNYWKRYYPEGKYVQLYGPTEITGACTFYNVTREYSDTESIPIGKPFRNTGIILLDKDNNEIENGKPYMMGEICVFGTCLAAGYYNNSQKTKEVFVQNPLVKGYTSRMYRTGDLGKWDEDGNLVFVSRKDYQIKHGGKRIELGEIEIAVQSIREIEACCCVHNKAQDILVLYYIGEVTDREIMAKVKDKLPRYMIPTVYHKQGELPTLPSGKLNRKLMEQWANE